MSDTALDISVVIPLFNERANLAPLAVLLLAGLFLVRWLGPLGVAVSLLLSTTATGLVMFLFFSRTVRGETA